jgi:hypothetical protein
MSWSIIEGKPKEVKVKGKIHAIFDYVPTNKPLPDHYAVNIRNYSEFMLLILTC